MKPILRLFAAFLVALPLLGQAPAQLKQELHTKEVAAKQDPDALFEVGKWAEAKGLGTEAKRIYQAVLKIKPDHEGANKAVGNELVDGKWLSAKDAAAARKKAQEAEFRAKGMVEVAGVYVDKEFVADAKRGIFHYENDLVTKEELLALTSGMVRHPITGQLIEAKHLAEAQSRKFPIGSEGRWADEKDADRFHADAQRAWVVRSAHCTLISTLPIAKLEEMKPIADRGVERARLIMNSLMPRPVDRPAILIAATDDEFRTFGTQGGDETSSYGAFLGTERARIKLEYQGEVRPAFCHWHQAWGPYYLRHAAALAYVEGLCIDADAEVPLWFLHAVGAYASRFDTDNDAGSFGEQHVQKGGVKDLKGWFNSFAINGEMEPKQIDYNIFQAGLMISFVTDGGDAKVIDAMKEIAAAFTGGKGKAAEKGIEKLKGLLIGKESELRAHLQKLIKKGKA